MLWIYSDYYPNLVSLELVISDSLVRKMVSTLFTSFTKQLEKLSVKFYFGISSFETDCITVIQEISQFSQLNSLNIELVPFVSTTNFPRAPIDSVFKQILLLSDKLKQIESVCLSIDVRHIDCRNLDLLECVVNFERLTTLSLIIYGNVKEVQESGLKLNFDKLKDRVPFLKTINLDCTNLTCDDVELLGSCCPDIQTLHIGTDKLFHEASFVSLGQNLKKVKSFTVGVAISTMYANTEQSEKFALTINKSFYEMILNRIMPNLKTIRFNKCCIDIDENLFTDCFAQIANENSIKDNCTTNDIPNNDNSANDNTINENIPNDNLDNENLENNNLVDNNFANENLQNVDSISDNVNNGSMENDSNSSNEDTIYDYSHDDKYKIILLNSHFKQKFDKEIKYGFCVENINNNLQIEYHFTKQKLETHL